MVAMSTEEAAKAAPFSQQEALSGKLRGSGPVWIFSTFVARLPACVREKAVLIEQERLQPAACIVQHVIGIGPAAAGRHNRRRAA